MLIKYRRAFLTVVILCVVGTCSYMSAHTEFIKDDKSIEQIVLSQSTEILPEKVRNIIMSADSVKGFLIDSWTPNDSITMMFGEAFGEVLQTKTVEDSLMVKSFSDMLVSPDSFQNEGMVKESTFMPDFAVLFISQRDSVIVSYSLYCDICRFQSRDEVIDLDGEKIRNEFIRSLKGVFPKDKFVRNISKRL